ncbi:MAG: hypothetical protein OXM55_06720, partial [Bdellovibrionales bacterium]|nr:hypothetical protein [Bdellovibrionales bacterium]
MFPVIFRITIFLLFPFIFLAESSALSSQENTFNLQSKKTVLLARNTYTLSQQTSSTTKTARRGRVSVRKSDPIKAQYENCKG